MTRDELVDALIDATSTGQVERALMQHAFALVPIEPTEAMQIACIQSGGMPMGEGDIFPSMIWKAMLKAAEDG